MNSIELSYLVFGVSCTLLGAGVLYFSWKSNVQLKEAFTLAGWTLLVVALFPWIELNEWEFGTLYAITLPSLAALFYVSCNIELNKSSVPRLFYDGVKPPSRCLVLGCIGKLLLILPFALTASVFVSYGISILLLTSELNQMVLAICTLPIVWGLFAYWILADTKTVRPVASQAGLTALFLIPVLQV